MSEIGLISVWFFLRQTALLRRKCVRKKKSPRRLSHHSECCNILWRCEKVVRVKYGHVSIRKASANAPCCPFAHRGKIVDFKRFSTRGDSQFWLYFFKLKGCSAHTVSNSVNGPLISNLYPYISPRLIIYIDFISLCVFGSLSKMITLYRRSWKKIILL